MGRWAEKLNRRTRRKIGIRKRLSGTSVRPRVTIFKSNRFTYLQAVDDTQGVTLAAVSNRQKDLSGIKNNTGQVGKLGEKLAEKLKDKKIEQIVFDRNGYLYHGILKTVADGMRKSGIKF
jgi:large subunit ribosomal protein L18